MTSQYISTFFNSVCNVVQIDGIPSSLSRSRVLFIVCRRRCLRFFHQLKHQ